MTKTLDMVALLHRLILGIAFALCIVGLSIHSPSSSYGEAEQEINTLQGAVEAVNEQVGNVFEKIYDGSELKASTLDWLSIHGASQKDVPIEVILSGDLQIPDASIDPLVTLESQVKWADRIYRDDDNPFYLCSVQHPQLLRALNRLFPSAHPPFFQKLIVFVRRAQAEVNATVRCDLQINYAMQVGTLSGTRSVLLDVPTTAVAITEVAPPGPKWIDMDLADTLKGNGLGDFEDNMSVVLPSVEQFWAEIGNRPPSAALARLGSLKNDDLEKSKEKIDILGQSLSGSLTIMLTSLAELCLIIYCAVLVHQVNVQFPGHIADIAESQFFGIMTTAPGRAVIFISLLFPLGVVAYSLLHVFPSFAREWPGPAWQVSLVSRSIFLFLLAIAEVALLLEIRGILNSIRLDSPPSDGAPPQPQAAATKGSATV